MLVRYDTTAAFTAATAWTALDLSLVVPSPGTFAGAVFDGQYLYLVPESGTTVPRFQSLCPAPNPPGARGSTF
jgi:hypothetical protein